MDDGEKRETDRQRPISGCHVLRARLCLQGRCDSPCLIGNGLENHIDRSDIHCWIESCQEA